MKRFYKGSSVVEMAFIMPLVLGVWMAVIFVLFFYHDKGVMQGAAYESAVVGSELWMDTSEEKIAKIEGYFQERIDGKLLFFYGADAEVSLDKKGIRVKAEAVHHGLYMKVESYFAITEPEKEVRKIKVLQQGMGGEKE